MRILQSHPDRQKQPIRVTAFPYCPSCVSVSDGKAVSPSREAYFDLQEETTPTSTRLRRTKSIAERERERGGRGKVDITSAGPSDARGSVAIVLPHLPSICRRSIFNKLPASLPLFPSYSFYVLPLYLYRCYWPGNRLLWLRIRLSVTSVLMKPSNLQHYAWRL